MRTLSLFRKRIRRFNPGVSVAIESTFRGLTTLPSNKILLGRFISTDADRDILLLDDPKLMHGAPVNLQVVAQRLHDEQLLSDTELIESVLNGKDH